MADNNNNNNDAAEVFVYMGGDMVVPQDVARVRVHPSVTVIPDKAFYKRIYLNQVELCEGLVEIGESAFHYCMTLEEVVIYEGLQERKEEAFAYCLSLIHINFPSTLRVIGNGAFRMSFHSALESLFGPLFDQCHPMISLPDGLENIGEEAFMSTRCTNFRVPPRITTIPKKAISSSNCIFSVELSESVSLLGDLVFAACPSLRNITIPSDSEIVFGAFDKCTDLLHIFGTQAQIISTLKHRFGNLPSKYVEKLTGSEVSR